jgi:hypothetical protein
MAVMALLATAGMARAADSYAGVVSFRYDSGAPAPTLDFVGTHWAAEELYPDPTNGCGKGNVPFATLVAELMQDKDGQMWLDYTACPAPPVADDEANDVDVADRAQACLRHAIAPGGKEKPVCASLVSTLPSEEEEDPATQVEMFSGSGTYAVDYEHLRVDGAYAAEIFFPVDDDERLAEVGKACGPGSGDPGAVRRLLATDTDDELAFTVMPCDDLAYALMCIAADQGGVPGGDACIGYSVEGSVVMDEQD